MWLEKYQAQSINDLIATKQQANKLKALYTTTTKNTKAKSKTVSVDNPVVLVTGPHGNGKHEMLRLVAKELQMRYIQIDANMERNKDYMTNILALLKSGNVFTTKQDHAMIVFDDLVHCQDGIVQFIQSHILKKRVAKHIHIVLILHDDQYKKINEWKKRKVHHLKTMKPSTQNIVQFLYQIVLKEITSKDRSSNLNQSLYIKLQQSIIRIVQESHLDIRQSLIRLELEFDRFDTIELDVQSELLTDSKPADWLFNSFDATKYVINERLKPATQHIREQLINVTPTMEYLLFKNYLQIGNTIKSSTTKVIDQKEMDPLKVISDCAEAFSFMNMFDNNYKNQSSFGYSNQNYELNKGFHAYHMIDLTHKFANHQKAPQYL